MGQVVRFVSAGAIGTVLYYVTLYVLTEFGGVWYLASSFIAWALDLAVKYSLQKRWAFRNYDLKSARRQRAQYGIMSVSFLVIGSFLTVLLVEVFGVWYMTAQIVLGLFFSIAGYLICRRIFALRTP